MGERWPSSTAGAKRIWIDLDNTPHVPFFKPIIGELSKRGCSVILTVRDCFQVCELADLLGLRYRVVGRHYGKKKVAKLFGLVKRALQLVPTIVNERPDLALSHGSRAQILAASMLGTPLVVIMDYEHSTSLPFRGTTRRIIIPEVVPSDLVRKYAKSVSRHPGIKEDVYAPSFEPDSSILDVLGIDREDILATVRPPATEAHYHSSKSDLLFEATMDFLCRRSDVHIVLLPRNEKQSYQFREKWHEWQAKGRITIPEHAVDGLNLIWHSDLVVSGGGTMNREAAALGVPVFSIFGGKIGAVDSYLVDVGRLVVLESVQDVQTKLIVARRRRPSKPDRVSPPALQSIVEDILATAAESG